MGFARHSFSLYVDGMRDTWPNKSLEPTASTLLVDYIVACYCFALPYPCRLSEAVAQLCR